MSSIRKYRITHNYDVVSFDIEIDLSKPACLDMSCYPNARYGNSIKTDIVAMSLFWCGNPGKDADFEEHLKFFLEVLSRKLAHIILNETSIPNFLYQHLISEEGYSPCFGDAIKIDNVDSDDDFLTDYLYIQEK